MIAKRIGLLYYGLLSILESVWNLIVYIFFLDEISKNLVADFSVPAYFSYCNKFMKKGFIKGLNKNES